MNIDVKNSNINELISLFDLKNDSEFINLYQKIENHFDSKKDQNEAYIEKLILVNMINSK